MLRSWLKQVVIAGITPFQFIERLLWWRYAPAQSDPQVQPDFLNVLGILVAVRNPDSSGKGTVPPVPILVPGTVPFRIGSRASPLATSGVAANGNRARPRSGKQSSPPRASRAIAGEDGKFGPACARNAATCAARRIIFPLPSCGRKPRNLRPVPRPTPTPALRCRSVRQHRKSLAPRFAESRPPARSLR